MEMSPNQVRTATFGSARKGFDPAEVTAFLDRAAEALEAAQNHATAMEARARAAVAKLQELSAGGSSVSSPSSATSTPHPESETISRTLLLAQRAADEAIAEARAEAARLVEEARGEARQVGAVEQEQVRSEVDALAARREFLHADVEQLENFLLDQRERLRTAANALVQVAERVPDGLGYLRPPVLSASDEGDVTPAPFELVLDPPVADDPGPDAPAADAPAADEPAADAPVAEEASGRPADEDGPGRRDDAPGGGPPVTADPDGGSPDSSEALPVIRLSDEDDAPRPGAEGVGTDDPTPESSELPFGPGAGRGPTGRGGNPGPPRGSGR